MFDTAIDLQNPLAAATWAHPLGTDQLGRDLALRLAQACTEAVLPLWLMVALSSAAGLGLALLSSDLAVRLPRSAWCSRVIDTIAAVATALPVNIAVFIWAALQRQAGLTPVMLGFGCLCGLRAYLQVRDLQRQDSHLAYWTAHAALGGTLTQRLWHYGLRSAWRTPLAASFSFQLSAVVASEATLSYLGYGIQEPRASFGNMLAGHFELYLHGHWYVLGVIVAAMTACTLLPPCLLRLFLGLRTKFPA